MNYEEQGFVPDPKWTEEICEVWRLATYQLEMEYGILVRLRKDFDNCKAIKRIYFFIEGHEFETLKDARKALDNKQFL